MMVEMDLEKKTKLIVESRNLGSANSFVSPLHYPAIVTRIIPLVMLGVETPSSSTTD